MCFGCSNHTWCSSVKGESILCTNRAGAGHSTVVTSGIIEYYFYRFNSSPRTPLLVVCYVLSCLDLGLSSVLVSIVSETITLETWTVSYYMTYLEIWLSPFVLSYLLNTSLWCNVLSKKGLPWVGPSHMKENLSSPLVHTVVIKRDYLDSHRLNIDSLTPTREAVVLIRIRDTLPAPC